MLRISLYNVSAQKRRLTQIFADYYSNYLFLICANLRKSVFLIISFYFAYLLISPFLRIYTASAVAVYIHRRLQYIFNCKLGVFPFVELVYLIVVLLGHYPAEKALHVREVGVAVFIQVFLSGGYLPEVRYLKKGSYRQLSPASAGWDRCQYLLHRFQKQGYFL